MIKSELIERIAKRQVHLMEKDVALSVNKLIEKITEHLKKGGRIEIRDFGCFTVRHRKKRLAHNPRTGKEITTDPKYVVHFKPGRELKKCINDGAKAHTITTTSK